MTRLSRKPSLRISDMLRATPMRPNLPLCVMILGVGCGDNVHPNGPDASNPTDVAVDVAPCTPTTIKLGSVMSGDAVMDATEAGTVIPLSVSLAHSVLFTSLREDETSPNFGAVLCDLHDADQPAPNTPAGISCYRNNAGTDTASGVIHIHWTVATFTSGVTVQRGHADTNVANPSTVALVSPVDIDSSFVLLGGDFNGGSGWGNNEFVRAHLTSSQTLEIRTDVPGTEVAWQVVSMMDAKVQRGTATFASADTSKTSPITNAVKPVVLTTYTTDNASSIAASTMLLRASSDNNTITFTREMSGSALDVAWEAVTFPFVTNLGSTMFAAGELTKSTSVPSLPAASSVVFSTNQAIQGQSVGSTTYAGADLDAMGEGTATIAVTANSVDLTRASGTAAATFDWAAVDFATDRCMH